MYKKNIKKVFAIILTLLITMQAVPLSFYTTKAADATKTSVADVVKENGVKYVWYDDISSYRVKSGDNYDKHPVAEGYVFGGWFSDSDDTSEAIGKDVTTDGAWAKFVPENTLSVKGQVSKRMKDIISDASAKVRFRVVTSVDSLRYDAVGFTIALDGYQTMELPMDTVMKTITLVDDDHGETIEEPKNHFDAASKWFATLEITEIPNANSEFTKMDITVIPYWTTLDGTKVQGITRSNMLISDELTNNEDGTEDFSLTEKTYTYNNLSASTDGASYKYFKGGSNTVYLKGTYTTAGTGNKFGITIRNGGETRQVYYDGMGVVVYSGEDIVAATNTYNTLSSYNWSNQASYPGVNSAFIWGQTASVSAVSSMLENTTDKTHDVIWGIEKNILYGSVDGFVFLRIPMNVLCSEWVNGRTYQLGVASYNSDTLSGEKMQFALSNLDFGKAAYGTGKLIAETETMTGNDFMRYEAITGSYMSQTAANFGGGYVVQVAQGTPIAVETDISWQNLSISTGNAGIDIRMGDTSKQLYIEPSKDTGTWAIYAKPNRTWTPVENLTSKYTISSVFDENQNVNIKAAIYDGKLYILVNDAPAYECTLVTLFGDSYEANKSGNIRLGFATWNGNNGQAQFKNVKVYEGPEAINLKTENWTFYPGATTIQNTTSGTRTSDTKNGTIYTTGGNWGHYETVPLGVGAKVWEVTGTMNKDYTKDDANWPGFAFSQGTKALNVLITNGGVGFRYSTNAVDSYIGTTLTDVAYPSDYAYRYGYSLTNNYGWSSSTKSYTFKIVVVNDTVYGWLNGSFTWMIPLTESQFGSFTADADYVLRLAFGHGEYLPEHYSNVKVKTDSEVDIDFINALEVAKEFNWKDATTMKNLTEDGKIVSYNTAATGDQYIYAKTKSNSIYFAGTWNPKVMSGITLSDGTDTREIRFHNQGVTVMKQHNWAGGIVDATDTNYASIYGYDVINKTIPRTDETNMTNDYVWAVRADATATNSAIVNMLATKDQDHKVVWAVYEDTLYCSVDGHISLILPLEKICTTWTKGSNTQYQIGLSQWDVMTNGDMPVTGIKLLYGEEAEAKLVDNSIGITETTNMVYDAIDGAYVPRTKANFAGMYGAAAKTVAVEADVEWADHANVGGAAGITVKSNGKSMQVYFEPAKGFTIFRKNYDWRTYSPSDVTIGNGTGQFKSTSHVTAVVESDILYIYYDGEMVRQIPLMGNLDGYTVGADVQIGLTTWNANSGLVLFKNVKMTTGTNPLAAFNLAISWGLVRQ